LSRKKKFVPINFSNPKTISPKKNCPINFFKSQNSKIFLIKICFKINYFFKEEKEAKLSRGTF